MEKVEVYGKLVQIAATVFEVDESEISKDLKAGMLAKWDSLGHLSFFMSIQEELGMQFSTDEIVELSSIEDITKAIQNAVPGSEHNEK